MNIYLCNMHSNTQNLGNIITKVPIVITYTAYTEWTNKSFTLFLFKRFYGNK